MQFWPVKDFKWFHNDRLRAHYVPGLSYRVRPGDGDLAEKLQEWIAEGKVSLTPPDNATGAGAGMSGEAEVK